MFYEIENVVRESPVQRYVIGDMPFHKMAAPDASFTVIYGESGGRFKNAYAAIRAVRREYEMFLAYQCPADEISFFRARRPVYRHEETSIRIWLA